MRASVTVLPHSRVLATSDDRDWVIAQTMRRIAWGEDIPLPSLPDVRHSAHVIACAAKRTAPVWETWMCKRCRTWTSNGAYKTGRCNRCDYPRTETRSTE